MPRKQDTKFNHAPGAVPQPLKSSKLTTSAKLTVALTQSVDLPVLTAPRAPGRFLGWTAEDLERFNRVRQVLAAPSHEPLFTSCDTGRALQAEAKAARDTLHDLFCRRPVTKEDRDQLEKVKTRIVAFRENPRLEECCASCHSVKTPSTKKG